MSKFIICLLLLFNYYNCEEKNMRIFTEKDVKKEIDVREGEEFIIKLKNVDMKTKDCIGYLWRFVNEGDVKSHIVLLKKTIEKTTEKGLKKILFGETEYTLFHFKAVRLQLGFVSVKLSYAKKYTRVSKYHGYIEFKINVH